MTSFVGGPLLLPPKIEDLTISYLTPYMTVPIVTRLPKPAALANTVGRHSAGGSRTRHPGQQIPLGHDRPAARLPSRRIRSQRHR